MVGIKENTHVTHCVVLSFFAKFRNSIFELVFYKWCQLVPVYSKDKNRKSRKFSGVKIFIETLMLIPFS